MRILAILVIPCTLLCIGCNSDKSDYDAGIAAYKRGHYAVALSNFESRAMKGDPVAQYCLAFMYRNGKGIRADEDKAIYWYTESANQDYAPAQNNLAALHFQTGKNVQYHIIERLGRGEEVTDQIKERDDSLRIAMQWLQKAEKQNNPTAHYNIALVHYFDAIIHEEYDKNKDEFIRLLKRDEKLSEKANKESEQDEYPRTTQELLEFFRSASTTAKKSYAEAVSWFTKAAIGGYPQAQYELANRYYNGEGVDGNLKETERWEKAFDWYTKAENYPPAQNALAKMYAEGKGIEKNTTKAVELYKKAEKKEHADAQFNLAEMYSREEGIDENLKETERWEEIVRLYTKAADQGHRAAQNNLAKVYTEGISIAEGNSIFKNPEKAVRLFFRAAQQGNPVAQANIGRNFETGLYNSKTKRYEVFQDDEEAYYWYGLALKDPVKLDELAATENYADKVDKWREGIENKLGEDKKSEIQKRIDSWKPRILVNSGTGFYIDKKHILTNAHVARQEEVLPDGNKKWHEYNELRIGFRHVVEKPGTEPFNGDIDLALLLDPRGNMDNFATFRNDPLELDDVGEDIASFGYPLSSSWLSYQGNGTSGVISGLSGTIRNFLPDNLFQHTAPIQGGNSGGPVFDLFGNVVGVTVSQLTGTQNVNFAIKFNAVEEFLGKNGLTPLKIDLDRPINDNDVEKIFEKARQFTFPVLCFKNKVDESLLLHEIRIEDLKP